MGEDHRGVRDRQVRPTAASGRGRERPGQAPTDVPRGNGPGVLQLSQNLNFFRLLFNCVGPTIWLKIIITSYGVNFVTSWSTYCSPKQLLK